MQAVRAAADEVAFAARFPYHHILLTLLFRSQSLPLSLSLILLFLNCCLYLSLQLYSVCLRSASFSLFVPSPFASRIKYTLCVCTLSLGHFQAQWLTVDFAVSLSLSLCPPSLSFSVYVCLSVAALSMRLRHTFLASFFYSFLFCFCPRLVYIFTLEFAPCVDAAVIFQAVFQPTSNAHTHTYTHTEGERRKQTHTLSGLYRLWTFCFPLPPTLLLTSVSSAFSACLCAT